MLNELIMDYYLQYFEQYTKEVILHFYLKL